MNASAVMTAVRIAGEIEARNRAGVTPELEAETKKGNCCEKIVKSMYTLVLYQSDSVASPIIGLPFCF